MKELKSGQVIMVYQDPLTENRPEGEAKLIRKLDENKLDQTEYWDVLFVGDDPDQVCSRIISIK